MILEERFKGCFMQPEPCIVWFFLFDDVLIMLKEMKGLLLLDFDILHGAFFEDGLEHAGLGVKGDRPWNLHVLINIQSISIKASSKRLSMPHLPMLLHLRIVIVTHPDHYLWLFQYQREVVEGWSSRGKLYNQEGPITALWMFVFELKKKAGLGAALKGSSQLSHRQIVIFNAREIVDSLRGSRIQFLFSWV